MDGRPYMLDWRARVAAGELVGPAIVTAGPIIDGSPPLRDDNLAVADAAAAAAAVDAQAAAGYDFIKVYTNLSPDALQGAAEAARRHGLPLSGHVPREVGLAEAMRTLRSIEHLVDYGDAIDAREASDRRWHWSNLFLAMPADEARITNLAGALARSGTWTVPTLIQAERALARPGDLERWRALPEMTAVPAPFIESWIGTVSGVSRRLDEADWQIAAWGRANRLALVAALHRGGAPLMAGSDTPNPFVVPGASMHDELALLVEAGLTPGEALITATRDPARYLGQDRVWGTIESGRRADLILLGSNPLADIAATRQRIGVMAAGRWFDRAALDRMERALIAD
jgi:imidazolonepropionase-like amidohydrolase